MESDEIAIVGAGCRFPGADNLEEYWRVLVNAENHVKEITLERWNHEAFYDADKNAKGKYYVTRAGLLNSHNKWDNKLFGIGDNEATQVDPQQRYVLECVHMALEDAGITRAQLNGSKTGVMIGCMNDDYKALLGFDGDGYTSYSATGMSTSVISARVAYVYNLHGTCLTLDTACSSALVAIHLASQALKTGDCDAVICGGVSSIISPYTFIPLSKAKMMSTVGQCQTFCETADGYARGEGCGIVILKRLSDALKDGNKIWGTIQTGSNQDGCMEKPITAPSGDQQANLLKQVYENHKVDPASIQYIEAHGTGTPRGDPTEINALGEFFITYRQRDKTTRPLLIGSVKSNIGHTESAAGIAGLLKVLLMMKHGKYVPSLHVKPDKSNLNRKIRLKDLNLDIALHVEDWEEVNGERTACLNSFGFGGSNAHAIVKQRSTIVATDFTANDKEGKVLPVCLSAIDVDSLKQNLLTFQKDLQSNGSSLRDISYTSLFHRDVFSYRTLVFGKNADDLILSIENKLKTVQDIQPKRDRNVVFVFCGVGTTWTGMCRELMVKNEPFRTMITAIDELLFPLSGWKIGDKLSSETNYDDPFLNHIAIFAVQVALSNMWKAYGIEPGVIVGQSVGEVAAAHVANLLSLKEAVSIIYHRSKILSEQSVGTMMVVGNMNIEEIEAHCRDLDDRVSVAVYSSPEACTLSGLEEDIQELKQRIEKATRNRNKSVLIKELGVKCAYHSKHVEPCIPEIRRAIDECLKNTSEVDVERMRKRKKVPMVSTVTGCVTSLEEVRTGEYWANNVRMPVKFMQGISESLAGNGTNLLLEIGPRPVLRAHLPAIMRGRTNAKIFPSLLANKELSRVYSTISELFENNVDFDWPSSACPEKNRRISEIPRYAFQRSTDLHYPDKVQLHLAGVRKESSGSHMFVSKFHGSNCDKFEILVNEINTPFVYEHFLSETILVPGATYVETGFRVGIERLKKPVNQLSVKVDFVNTFTPVKDKEYRIQVETNVAKDGSVSFLVKTDNRTLAVGKIKDKESPAERLMNISKMKAKLHRKLSKDDVYKSLADINFTYGKRLSLINSAWASSSECLAEIHFPENSAEELTTTNFHPAIVDAVFQMFGVLNERGQLMVPKGVGTVTLVGHLEHKMYCYARETHTTNTSTHYNALLLSPTGSVIAEFKNFHTKALSGSDTANSVMLPLELNWEELDQRVKPMDPLGNVQVVVFTTCIQSPLFKDIKSMMKIIFCENVTEAGLAEVFKSGCSSVVYHVGPSSVESKSEDGVLGDSVRRFMDVKIILSALSRQALSVPLTILTENTQPFTGRKEINLNGSELWGMMRSASHEGLHSNWKLLDIDSENVNPETLAWMLTNIVPLNKEFQQIRDKVYEAKLKRIDRDSASVRELNIRQRKEMCLSSSKPGLVEQPFFHKEQSNGCDDVKQSEYIEIKLTVTVLHDASVYLSTVNKPIEDDQWGDESGLSHYQMLTIEGQGKVLNNEKEMDTNVIFCYPVSTKTEVSIPPECVMRKKDCLPYKNGLLIELIVLSSMIAALPQELEVILITEHDKGGLCRRFCEETCKQRGIKTTLCRLKDIRRKHIVNQVVNMILAASISPDNLETLLRKYPSVKEMVSIQSLLSLETQTWAQYKFPDTTITVLRAGDIFSPSNLKTSMPVIKEYLKSSKQTVQTAALLYALPMKEISLENMVLHQNSKFLCDKNNLFDSQSCYVLIGGLTGLGWELLKLLAEMGAGYIIPMSRREPSGSQKDELSSIMRKYGCHIYPLQADISDFRSLQNIFAKIDSDFHGIPVRGILHGAGVLSDTLLLNQHEETVRKVLMPKVLGTWNLHEVSLKLPLDFFVMHSSIVSVIGNQGQCNYAAGNSFMDSLAAYRQSIGLPAQSLNWGALAVGMATNNPETEKALNSRGFKSLHTDQIKQLFIDSLMNNDSNVILADIDWNMLASNPSFMDQKVKYESLMGSGTHTKQDSVNKLGVEYTKLMDLDPANRQKQVLKILKSIVNEIFVVDKNSINSTTSLVALGVDSMQAMSFSNKLNDMFSCQIPLISLLSEQSTLSVIAESIISSMRAPINVIEPHSNTSLQTLEANNATEIDTDYLFASDDYTFMQIGSLEQNRLRKTDVLQVRISEAELKNFTTDLNTWKKVLEHVMKINPELRKLYSFSSNGQIKVRTVPPESAKPNVTIETMDSLLSGHAYDRTDDITFDLENDLPIRLRIGQNETGSLFRILLHGVIADTTSTAIICKDIQTTMLCFTEKKDLPAEKSTVKIAQAIRNAVKPKLQDLQSFWSSYLSTPLAPVSFGFPITDVNDEHYEQSSCMVPQSLVQQIQRYMGQKRLTLYNIMLSVYQLLLHFETGAKHIPVGTAVDMRYHVPELAKAITRCTNYVPVVATVDSNHTIDDYIAENSRNISKTTQHATYPSNLYNKETKEHLDRHKIVMNDISSFRVLEQSSNIKAITSKLRHETFLRVKYDMRNQWVEVEFGFNSEIVGYEKGEHLPQDLVHLIETCLKDTSKRIADICEGREVTPVQALTQEISDPDVDVISHRVRPPARPYNEMNEIGSRANGNVEHNERTVLIEDNFLKQTSQGWDHRVAVQLVEHGRSGRLVLEWCKNKTIWSNKTRSLDLRGISPIKLLKLNGLSAIVMKTSKRWFVLKTANHNQAQQWMSEITHALERLWAHSAETQVST